MPSGWARQVAHGAAILGAIDLATLASGALLSRARWPLESPGHADLNLYQTEGGEDEEELGVQSAEVFLSEVQSGTEPAAFYLHIPKTAMTSFMYDTAPLLPHRKIAEGCLSWAHRLKVKKVLVLLRNPRDHVLSMYYHCKSSKWSPIGVKVSMPETFGAWVGNWTQLVAKGKFFGNYDRNHKREVRRVWDTNLPFQCYSPVDMQVQSLTCNNVFDYPVQADVELALEAMERTYFIGLAEAYRESLCLLTTKLTGQLPEYCKCGSPQWASATLHHVAHNVTEHSIGDQPEAVVKAVDELTRGDGELYRQAVKRFVREVEDEERRFGVEIFCNDTKQRLLR